MLKTGIQSFFIALVLDMVIFWILKKKGIVGNDRAKDWIDFTMIGWACMVALITLLPGSFMAATRSVAWQPFHTFWEVAQNGQYGALIQYTFNVWMFVPFGLFYPLAFPRNATWKRTLGTGVLIPCAIESVQFLCGRIFDIDDILANGFGVLIGYFAYKSASSIVRFCRTRVFQWRMLGLCAFTIGLVLLVACLPALIQQEIRRQNILTFAYTHLKPTEIVLDQKPDTRRTTGVVYESRPVVGLERLEKSIQEQFGTDETFQAGEDVETSVLHGEDVDVYARACGKWLLMTKRQPKTAPLVDPDWNEEAKRWLYSFVPDTIPLGEPFIQTKEEKIAVEYPVEEIADDGLYFGTIHMELDPCGNLAMIRFDVVLGKEKEQVELLAPAETLAALKQTGTDVGDLTVRIGRIEPSYIFHEENNVLTPAWKWIGVEQNAYAREWDATMNALVEQKL